MYIPYNDELILYIGQIWVGRKTTRTINNLTHEGYDPDDPNDMGSFAEDLVYYKINGKQYSCQDYQFYDWINQSKAKLFYEPEQKIGW